MELYWFLPAPLMQTALQQDDCNHPHCHCSNYSHSRRSRRTVDDILPGCSASTAMQPLYAPFTLACSQSQWPTPRVYCKLICSSRGTAGTFTIVPLGYRQHPNAKLTGGAWMQAYMPALSWPKVDGRLLANSAVVQATAPMHAHGAWTNLPLRNPAPQPLARLAQSALSLQRAGQFAFPGMRGRGSSLTRAGSGMSAQHVPSLDIVPPNAEGNPPLQGSHLWCHYLQQKVQFPEVQHTKSQLYI